MTNTNIENPRLWRLALELSPQRLDAVVWSPVKEASLLHFTVALNPTLPPVKAVEEAIYATPVLLSDYLGVDVVMHTNTYTVLPTGFDGDSRDSIARYTCPTDGGDPDSVTRRTDSTPYADVVWSADADMINFLSRTFRNPRMHCHISPLIHYFGSIAARGNTAKLYAHLSGTGADRQIDIIVYDRQGRLTVASTHAAPDDNDAVYYILATAQLVGLKIADGDEIQLCGDSTVRHNLMPVLRRYIKDVLPLIFPSAAYRNGREALNAPFPLAILPLCE